MAGYGHKWAVADFDETGGAAKAKSPVFQVASKAEGVVNYATVLSSSLDKDAKFDECTASMYKYADGVITICSSAFARSPTAFNLDHRAQLTLSHRCRGQRRDHQN